MNNVDYSNTQMDTRKKGPSLIVVVGVAVVLALILSQVMPLGELTPALGKWFSPEIRMCCEAIDAIGTVTMESLEAIEEAEALVEALPEEDRERVDNLEVLRDARKEYDRLDTLLSKASNAIGSAEDATIYIEEGDMYYVAVEDGGLVQNARQAYDLAAAEGLAPYLADKLPLLEAAEAGYAISHSSHLYLTAYDYQQAGNYEKAIPIYEELLATYPDSDMTPMAEYCLSECGMVYALEEAEGYFAARDYEAAYECMTEAEQAYGMVGGYLDFAKKLKAELDRIRPRNGTILDNRMGSGAGSFVVKAGDTDVYVKLEDRDNPDRYVTFYVQAWEQANIWVPDGVYIMKYACGENWYGQETMFGKRTAYSKADDLMEFETSYTSQGTYYSEITITLQTVVGGNMSSTTISGDSF